jgi:hypothetical protein
VTIGPEISQVHEDPTKLAVYIIIIVFALAILLYVWFGIIPGILLSYTMTTNIEMMKDREIQHQVIQIQRMERTKRSFRVY